MGTAWPCFIKVVAPDRPLMPPTPVGRENPIHFEAQEHSTSPDLVGCQVLVAGGGSAQALGLGSRWAAGCSERIGFARAGYVGIAGCSGLMALRGQP
ncbi:hypothetical protein [Brucella anthropi]|uniref:hypothetical protein n=1 Tax=Brucella anthropi TaxID=529 RepID=UPI00384EF2A5